MQEKQTPFAQQAAKDQNIQATQAIQARDNVRQGMCTEAKDGQPSVCLDQDLEGRAAMGNNDLPENLVSTKPGEQLIDNINEMTGLTKAQLKVSPFSDNYWPIYQGILAARYAAKDFPGSKHSGSATTNFMDYLGFVFNLDERDFHPIDDVANLSPGEKYDRLVGNPAYDMTIQSLTQGYNYFNGSDEEDDSKKVATWMGICHGWAPAAYMMDRPTSVVNMTAADGTEIPFYPSDIKALESLLWAEARTASKFVGGRCNITDPKRDEDTGRILDQECFDTNPATWHIATVNQIGVNGESFVLDATYDMEVWNQPVYSYTYSYFNPKEMEKVDTIEKATVVLKDFPEDKFKKYRKSKTHYGARGQRIEANYPAGKAPTKIVGVVMDVTYTVETQPNHLQSDSKAADEYTTARYYYDLEITDSGEIVGGEWYSQAHPDFLWTPAQKSARTEMDNYLQRVNLAKNWDSNDAIPSDILNVMAQARRRIKNKIAPSGLIVEALVAKSRKAGEEQQ